MPARPVPIRPQHKRPRASRTECGSAAECRGCLPRQRLSPLARSSGSSVWLPVRRLWRVRQLPLAASSTISAASLMAEDVNGLQCLIVVVSLRGSRRRLERGHVRFARDKFQGINRLAVERSPEFGQAFLGVLLKPRPDLRVERVEFDQFAGLGVLHGQHADVGQRDFVRVLNPHRHQIVPPMRLPHRAPQAAERRVLISARLEIGNQKHDGAARRDTVGKVQRLRHVRAAPLGLEVENFAYHAQHVAAALFSAGCTARPGR